MFDFLLALPQLPTLYDMRGDENVLSQSGTLSYLTPLQLACFLGDHDMCTHMLIRRLEVVWRWGLITQCKLNLEGIDSVGGGMHDVMELIGQLDATQSTRELLLDAFLQVGEVLWTRGE